MEEDVPDFESPGSVGARSVQENRAFGPLGRGWLPPLLLAFRIYVPNGFPDGRAINHRPEEFDSHRRAVV